MKVRFQADADLNQIIVAATLRREPTIDFLTATGAALAGLSDDQVLANAALSGRILVTHDRRTMPHQFAAYIAQNDSPGVLIVPKRLPISVTVDDLILIWATCDADEWTNCICVLPF